MLLSCFNTKTTYYYQTNSVHKNQDIRNIIPSTNAFSSLKPQARLAQKERASILQQFEFFETKDYLCQNKTYKQYIPSK